MAVILIKDLATLLAALAGAHGGETFSLAPGTYDQIALSSRTFANPVTIMSSDPSRPAVLGTIIFSKSSGIVFRNVDIGSPLKPGEKIEVATAAATINGSRNVTFDHVHVHGSLDGNAANDRYGLSFRGSSGIKITNSSFEQLTRAALFGSSSDILVQNSTFMHLRSDGIDFSGVHDVTIDGNFFGDYAPIEGDHPDAIQFWTRGTDVSCTDIRITNNQIQFGGAQGAQGIFMRDETNMFPYKRVTVDNNMIYVVAGYNGLAIGNGEDVTVTNNTVISRARDRYKLRISLGTIKGGTVANNVSDFLLTNAQTNVEMKDNLVLQDEAAKVALIPDTTKGPATTYRDLVISGKGYQPKSGAGLAFKPTQAAMAAAVAVNTPKVIPAGTVLLDLRLTNGTPQDMSSYKSKIGVLKPADGGGDSAGDAFRLGGRNYYEIAKGSAMQIYDLSAFTLAFTIKRAPGGGGGDGPIMRIHNSWYVSLNQGEIVFQYASTNGTIYKISSRGARINDRAAHRVDIAFDSAAGRLAFTVDGRDAGGGAIAGATRGPASWGLAIGNPFGESFHGDVGAVTLTAGSKAGGKARS